jgi:putative phage-type endonuclease
MPRLSPEELTARRTGMGSTCIVEANGLAPWKGAGPMRLFTEKLGIVSPDDEEEISDDGWLEWGHIMEPVIADWYERDRGARLLPGGPVHSQEHPHFWATLDRVVIGENRLVEIKNVGSPTLYSHWSTSSESGVPDYVRAQVTVAMGFRGSRETDVVASIGGRPPHVWRLFFDAELYDLLIDGALRFWQLVQDGTPPPLDATPATKRYLLAKYPHPTDPVIEPADEETHALALERLEAAARERAAKARKDAIDAELMARVGTRDGIYGEGWRFTWKMQTNGQRRQRFTSARLGDD